MAELAIHHRTVLLNKLTIILNVLSKRLLLRFSNKRFLISVMYDENRLSLSTFIKITEASIALNGKRFKRHPLP